MKDLDNISQKLAEAGLKSNAENPFSDAQKLSTLGSGLLKMGKDP